MQAQGGILMEYMTRRVILAAILGALVGVVLGYSPSVQPANAPRAELLTQQVAQPNVAYGAIHPSVGPIQLLTALAAGLVIAIPVFLISKQRSQD